MSNELNVRKTAFVTGGGTGIGKGIAVSLAKSGYDVAISYRGSEEGANDTLERIRHFGRKAAAIRADVSKKSDIDNMFSEFANHFERLDLFVNNAGITLKSSFIETSEEIFDTVCSVDFKGAFFCMQNAAKFMIDKNIKGSIVLISSNNAKAHFADVSVYGSVKAAAQKMAEHAAIELAKYGIRVNTVAPGWTDTGASRLDDKESTYYKIPLKKWTSVNEVADAVKYLASHSARSITGVTLTVDNGALLVSDKRERYGY